MSKQHSNWHKYFIGVLSLGLCMTLHVYAQGRGGGGGGGGGGFGGGGGIGGGARGGGASSTSSSSSVTRQYPANGMIPDAYFSIDPETRRVVVIAPEEAMPYVFQVLTNLDRPKPQVLIKVVFLEVQHNNSSDIGIEGNYNRVNNKLGSQLLGYVTNFGMVPIRTITGSGSNTTTTVTPTPGITGYTPISKTINVGNNFNLASGLASSGNAAGLYQILGSDFSATITAIAQAGSIKVLSRPSILARNNQPAQIVVGQQVPMITSVTYSAINSTPINSITYENVGVILNVTPFITADGLVEMIVNPIVSSLDMTTQIPISAGVYAPAVNTRSANTVVVTPDGQTVVLGGMMQSEKTTADSKIPILGDLPLLGNLFKHKQKSETQSELIIFLTPHIVQAPTQLAALSDREREKSTAPNAFSEKELNQFIDNLPARKTEATSKTGGRRAAGSTPVLPSGKGQDAAGSQVLPNSPDSTPSQ